MKWTALQIPMLLVSILVEAWLVRVLVKRKLVHEFPAFMAMIVGGIVCDVAQIASIEAKGLHPLSILLQQFFDVVLRSWVVVNLCRRAMVMQTTVRKTSFAVFAILTLLLATVTYTRSHSLPFPEGSSAILLLIQRSALLSQMGVLALLLLVLLIARSTIPSRDGGIAVGLAVTGITALVELSLRGGATTASPLDWVSFGGQMSGFLLWVMFLTTPEVSLLADEDADVQDPRGLARAANQR